MAAPAYATDLATILVEMPNATGWTLISTGGGGANTLTAPETDDFVQGANCISRSPWSSAATRGMVYNVAATIAAGNAVFIWIKSDATQALDTFANGGIQALIGSSSADLKCFYVDGNDTAVKGGWICYAIDPTATQSETLGTPAGTSYFGARWKVPTAGPSKGFPFKIDAMRRGRNVEVTAGDAGSPATWTLLAAHADATAQRWGVVQVTNTGAAVMGRVYWGTAGASVYSRDSNKAIVLLNTLGFVPTSFTQLLFAHASNDIVWDNVSVKALGTLNRGIINVTANGAITWTNSVYEGIDTTTMMAGSTFDGGKWISCNAITNPGGSMLGCSVLTPTVAADTSALVWNVATDPNTKLDRSRFTKGTAAHHAIEFGLSSPTSITLRNCVFTGFNTTPGAGDNQNDSTFHIKRTTGTVTINIVGADASAASTLTYRSDGATVVISAAAAHTVVGLELNTKVTYVTNATGTELYSETATTSDGAGKYQTTYSYGTAVIGTLVDVLMIHLDYIPYEPQITMPSADSTLPVVQTLDTVYSNP